MLLPLLVLMVLGYVSLWDSLLPKTKFGLYRDDGIILLRMANGQQMEKKRNTIIKISKKIGFSMDIETSLKEVEFIDVTLYLQDGTYIPYKNLTISCFKTIHFRSIYRKLSNRLSNYQIPCLKDFRKNLLTKKFSKERKLNTKMC